MLKVSTLLRPESVKKPFVGHLLFSIIIYCFCTNDLFASQVIPMHPLDSMPILDGSDEDWGNIPAEEIFLHQTRKDQKTKVDSIFVKGGVYGDRVYLYLTWKDDSKSIEHKPFVWDMEQSRYIQSLLVEDRLAIQFAMTGSYTTDWLSGSEFTADMWHWKAHRSNFLGLAQDKQTIISRTKLLRSYHAKTSQNETLYILRPSDVGDRLYKSVRYKNKNEMKMPKYILANKPQGSITDVKAKGVWYEGAWHLELSRAMNTHQDDDVVFYRGKQTLGGIAVFNDTGDDDHSVSETLLFQF